MSDDKILSDEGNEQVSLSPRELAYQNYDESKTSPDGEASAQDVKDEITEPEPDKTGAEADASDKEEKPNEVMEPLAANEKTIPLQAHIEVRSKLKEELRSHAEEIQLLKRQLEESKTVEDDFGVDESEKQINELKERLKVIEENGTAAQQAEVQRGFDKNIGALDNKLNKEGIAGFEMNFPTVKEELFKMARQDKENAMLYDNLPGYEKIYKEIVYPKLIKQLGFDSDAQSESKRQAKEEAAKKAGLIGSAGSSGEKKVKPPEPKTDEEHFKVAIEGLRAGRVL